jgi:uncharacterized protein with HEPN domain
MRLETQKYLFDILEAVNLITEFCAEESYERYAISAFLRSAVERQFITAGEALSQLAKIDALTFERVPDCRQVISFRNQLVHGYQSIDDLVVWGVVTTELVGLRQAVEKLLEEGETRSG